MNKVDNLNNLDNRKFTIGYNKCIVKEVCPICDEKFETSLPLTLYYEEIGHTVSLECAEGHAPELAVSLKHK